MLAGAAQRFGMHPKRTTEHRWWQELVAHRALEHDARGRLVWRTVVLSTARQVGKSWLLRELCLWRLSQAERLGEVQTVVHAASKLSQAWAVWRPASRWARQNGYQVRLANGEQSITAADGSTWGNQAANDDLGVSLSVGLGLVDEAWNVPRDVFENGLEPASAEAADPQMWLVSTANRPRVGDASDLMPTYRGHGLLEMQHPGRLLMVEWSAVSGADRADPDTWRAASPQWSDARAELVAGYLAKATSPEAVAAFDMQWLNIWPPRVVRSAAGSGLVAADDWAVLVVGGSWRWESVAVEASFGCAPVVAFAARYGAGVVVSVVQSESMQDAAELVAGSGLVPLVGKSLMHDPVWSLLGAQPRGATTAAAVTGFRQLVDDGLLAHDGGSVLSGQVALVRVERSLAGVRVVSCGRTDAIKAVVWAVDAARVGGERAAVW